MICVAFLLIVLTLKAMKVLDTDGDWNIDFDEFKSFMLKANISDACKISGER